MKILGIETSCDETAAGVVEDGCRLLSNAVASSMDMQAVYGGVVPEVAARSHIEVILKVIETALKQAKTDWSDIDGIAVTHGAGLSGSLLIGVMTARTLSIVKKKPLYAANHVLAHVYVNFLTDTALSGYTMVKSQPKFPMLAVIVSGGHSQLVLFHDHFRYELLGRTQDDAIGEAFDKVAKMLGLGYPGGPAIAKAAAEGDPLAYKFPIARMPAYNMSFSGLKTAVLRQAQALAGGNYTLPSIELPGRLNKAQKADIAASFQNIVVKTVVAKAKQAVDEFAPASVVIAGGVAASSELRQQLSQAIDLDIAYPDMKLCTDNGAMIAALGCYLAESKQSVNATNLEIQPNLVM